jgi:hypothetical protein
MAGNIQQLFATSERVQRIVIGGIAVLAILIVAFFGIAQSNDSARNVFWGAVNNSMAATALTISTTASTSGTTENILNQIDFGQHPSTLTLTTLSNGTAKAKTETLTTPKAEYVRYDSIHKVIHGKSVNFSHVIGVWAKTTSFTGSVIPPTFPQVLLDQLLPLPMGNLTPGERTDFLQQMQDAQIYTVNFSSAKKTTYQGRAAYVYAVSIQPVLYLQLIKSYAPDVDMRQDDQLNPNSYGGESNVSATWTIDAKAKELVKVDYGSGHTQTYGGWNVPITTPTPTHTVSASELQHRLGALL